MVGFDKRVLENGLRVLVHTDRSTPLAVVNLLYDVGARDESPLRTGFAHLFEHLMFEGSENVAEFDTMLQDAGGENNAFTTNDLTNYYISVPAQNLETALWLESDRLKGLAFSEEKLKVQKNVVIEEFRQSYLNQPYGDVWLLLRSLAYTVHPYQWSTIGKNIDHIQEATLEDVKAFSTLFITRGMLFLQLPVTWIPKMYSSLLTNGLGIYPASSSRNATFHPSPNKPCNDACMLSAMYLTISW
jgi:zinc protease